MDIEKFKKSFKPKVKNRIRELKKEAISIPELFDVRAENGTLYFSKNKNKLVYKTKDGSIKELYE